MKPSLNIIGCGKLGRTLAHLWHKQQLIEIGAVINRTIDSANSAVAFIGSGTSKSDFRDIPSADFWLIATPDGDILETAKQLAQNGQLDNSIVFHCSGALSSEILKTANSHQVCSVHPVHSFANPENSVQQFSGTYCACEGDPEALARVKPLFGDIGANLFDVDSHAKTVYHAASVLACNALVGLLDASLNCFAEAGVKSEQARALLLPIVHQTVDNALKGSPASALTGPVSRGDATTVSRQQQVLGKSDADLLEIYNSLGKQTLRIAKQQGLEPAKAESLKRLFNQ
jgi:predicted short-subunit dehydrogenase-like oxidoreductase (DUF2520 family)